MLKYELVSESRLLNLLAALDRDVPERQELDGARKLISQMLKSPSFFRWRIVRREAVDSMLSQVLGDRAKRSQREGREGWLAECLILLVFLVLIFLGQGIAAVAFAVLAAMGAGYLTYKRSHR